MHVLHPIYVQDESRWIQFCTAITSNNNVFVDKLHGPTECNEYLYSSMKMGATVISGAWVCTCYIVVSFSMSNGMLFSIIHRLHVILNRSNQPQKVLVRGDFNKHLTTWIELSELISDLATRLSVIIALTILHQASSEGWLQDQFQGCLIGDNFAEPIYHFGWFQFQGENKNSHPTHPYTTAPSCLLIARMMKSPCRIVGMSLLLDFLGYQGGNYCIQRKNGCLCKHSQTNLWKHACSFLPRFLLVIAMRWPTVPVCRW